jgi:predicted dehydrogenase
VPDHRDLLEGLDEVDAVTIALPNHLHADVALAALESKKHVVVEKPLCLTLAEADRLIAAAAHHRRLLGYAEELCFAPKYVRAKELADQGVLGRLFKVAQVESHAGPYSPWFFDPKCAGGGAAMDMGCHAIEFARWMFNKPKVLAVTAQMRNLSHPKPLEDHCLIHLELEGGRFAQLEASWVLKGGMDSLAQLEGSEGVLKIDLSKGMGLDLFTERAAGEIVPGWSRPDFSWLYNNGYPGEMAEFTRAIEERRAPSESGEDGRAVLEILWAAYASAAERRTIELPFVPPSDARWPAELWTR